MYDTLLNCRQTRIPVKEARGKKIENIQHNVNSSKKIYDETHERLQETIL